MIELVDKQNPDRTIAHACSKCRLVAPTREQALACCVPKPCELCSSDSETRTTIRNKTLRLCKPCWTKAWAEEHARVRTARLEKASKITEDEYLGKCLYSEDRDQYYFEGVAEYLEDIEKDQEPEDFLWAPKA